MAYNARYPQQISSNQFQPSMPEPAHMQATTAARTYVAEPAIDFRTAGMFLGQIQGEQEQAIREEQKRISLEASQSEQSNKDAKTQMINTMKNDYATEQGKIHTQLMQGQISPSQYTIKTRQLQDSFMKNTGGYININDLDTVEQGISGTRIAGKLTDNYIARQEEALTYQRAQYRAGVKAFATEVGVPDWAPEEDKERLYGMAQAVYNGTNAAMKLAQDNNYDPSNSATQAAPEGYYDEVSTALSNGVQLSLAEQYYKLGEAPDTTSLQTIEGYAENQLIQLGWKPMDAHAFVVARDTANGMKAFAARNSKIKADLATDQAQRTKFAEDTLKEMEVFKKTARLLFNNNIEASEEAIALFRNLPENEQQYILGAGEGAVLNAYTAAMNRVAERALGGQLNSTQRGSMLNTTLQQQAALGGLGADTYIHIGDMASRFLNAAMYGQNMYPSDRRLAIAMANNDAIIGSPEDRAAGTVSKTGAQNIETLNRAFEEMVSRGDYKGHEDEYAEAYQQYYMRNQYLMMTKFNTIREAGLSDNLRYDPKTNKFVFVQTEADKDWAVEWWDKNSPKQFATLSALNDLIRNPFLDTKINGKTFSGGYAIVNEMLNNTDVKLLTDNDRLLQQSKFSRDLQQLGRAVNQGEVKNAAIALGGTVLGLAETVTKPVVAAVQEAVGEATEAAVDFTKNLQQVQQEDLPQDKKVLKAVTNTVANILGHSSDSDKAKEFYNKAETAYEYVKDEVAEDVEDFMEGPRMLGEGIALTKIAAEAAYKDVFKDRKATVVDDVLANIPGVSKNSFISNLGESAGESLRDWFSQRNSDHRAELLEKARRLAEDSTKAKMKELDIDESVKNSLQSTEEFISSLQSK